MRITEIMTRNPEVVSPDTSLQATAQKMGSLDVGVMPVCDGKKLVGMITDRDITIRSTASGDSPEEIKVSDAMTGEVHYCFSDQSVQDATQLMKKHQIRRLPIIDRDNHELVGIVSLGDLAVDGASDEQSGEALEEISEPAKPDR